MDQTGLQGRPTRDRTRLSVEGDSNRPELFCQCLGLDGAFIVTACFGIPVAAGPTDSRATRQMTMLRGCITLTPLRPSGSAYLPAYVAPQLAALDFTGLDPLEGLGV